jgi:hypothetical protein
VQRDVLDDAVALVEDSEHRDALRHRCNALLFGAGRRAAAFGGDRGRPVLLFPAASTRGEAERAREQQ